MSDPELERILNLPPCEQEKLVEQMDDAIAHAQQFLGDNSLDRRIARLTAREDQIRAAVRDNPELIPAIAEETGLTVAEVESWLASCNSDTNES